MKVLKFKCTLLTDIILNRKAATEGPNETLDFIPGNNFLGIVAGKLYDKVTAQEALTLFHTGKVRFGDAHPSAEGFRSNKVPLTMYYPKLGSPQTELYIFNRIPNPSAPDILNKQLKQCRSGFFDFSSEEAVRVATYTDFAVKSAYDKRKRRSLDQQMFGYQSLRKGLTMYFAVEIDDDKYVELIRKALVGKRNVGRSRSAQYGLVEIAEEDYKEVGSFNPDNGSIAVYADSRLIFLDDNGTPTFRPSAEMLGLDGEIDWGKSQIRTFRYAPWNYKRQCFDTDRCGLEKGSVIIVNVKSPGSHIDPRYVGSYVNEGFGRVIYNPDFLKADKAGEAAYKLQKPSGEPDSDKDAPKDNQGTDKVVFTSPLIEYLSFIKESETSIYGKVNTWVKDYGKLFRGETFSSQWGQIRSMATTASSLKALKDELFREKYGYLVHGIAKEKWDEKGRLTIFREFVNSLDEATGTQTVVNLAAEMAKLCKAER